jgi:prophage antirepressor-like protein
MDSILAVFEYGNSQGRYFVDDHGDLWFVLIDILKMSDSKTVAANAQKTVEANLGRGLLNSIPLPDATGFIQNTSIVHEAAFTFLASRFRTEAGKKLNRYIHVELLPTIRKTGGYISSTATKEQLEGLQEQIKQHQAQIELLSAENKLLENYSDQLGFIADFLGCNFVYTPNKYVMSQDVLARFQKWVAPTTAKLFTNAQILRLIDENNKLSPLPKHKRFYIKKDDGGYGDLENASLVPAKQAKNNAYLRICAIGE